MLQSHLFAKPVNTEHAEFLEFLYTQITQTLPCFEDSNANHCRSWKISVTQNKKSSPPASMAYAESRTNFGINVSQTGAEKR